MASINGLHVVEEPSKGATNLKKRKRTASPDAVVPTTAKIKAGSLQGDLEAALKIINQHDSDGNIVKFPLTLISDDAAPVSKRRRTQSTGPQYETIESRIRNQGYKTYDQFVQDVDIVKKGLSNRINGDIGSDAAHDDRLEKVWNLLRREQERVLQPTSNSTGLKMQLLSLRGQTEGGVRQLFTGLPTNAAEFFSDLETKKLPNGFEIIDSALIDPTTAKSKEKRTFSDAFTPHRNLKALEAPRPRKTRWNPLEFIPTMSNLGSNNRHDYRNMSLGTGVWIRYSTTGSTETGQPVQNPPDKAANAKALFKAAFSSFAPSVDDSASMITGSDRAQSWYHKYELLQPLVSNVEDSSVESAATENIVDEELADDLEEIIANFVSESDVDGRDEGEKVLDEISDLIQTLSSYQAIRDSEHSQLPTTKSNVSEAEFDTYEMLRTQLKLLIDSLPPHAIAKLNGDQLGALNINTSVPISTPEISGTGQADDFTLRRQRAGSNMNSVAGRPTATAPSRPAYGTPGNAYNAQVQPYRQPQSATPYIAGSASNMYTTPRPGVPTPAPYSQQPYRAPATNYTTPAQQSYTQPANKFGQAYTPRASQPGYQQRAQDRGSAWSRPESPQKPITNGQTPQSYQIRQYSGQTPNYSTPSGTPAALAQPKSLDQLKQQQMPNNHPTQSQPISQPVGVDGSR